MGQAYTFEINGKRFSVIVEQRGHDEFEVHVGGQTFEVRYVPEVAPVRSSERGTQVSHPAAVQGEGAGPRVREVRAPIPGTVVSVDVQPGQRVAYGDKLLVLEAMKMKNLIRAPGDGRVVAVLVHPNQRVMYNDLLIRLEVV